MLVLGGSLGCASVVLKTPSSEVCSALDESLDVSILLVPDEHLPTESGRNELVLRVGVEVHCKHFRGMGQSFKEPLATENIPKLN